MKKILLLGALCTLGLGLAPAHADPTNGCQAVGVSEGSALTCTYTATGPGIYVAATPNHYTIDVTHTDENGTTTSRPVDSGSLTFPTTGNFAAAAGDTVTVTMGPDDAEGFVTGSIGIVAANDAG